MSWCFQRASPVGLGTDWMQLDRNQRTDDAGDMMRCMQDAFLIGTTHGTFSRLTECIRREELCSERNSAQHLIKHRRCLMHSVRLVGSPFVTTFLHTE